MAKTSKYRHRDHYGDVINGAKRKRPDLEQRLEDARQRVKNEQDNYKQLSIEEMNEMTKWT